MNYSPRDPELLAWLAGLPPETEYVLRCALMSASASFRRKADFKRRTDELRAMLKADERKLARLMERAERRAALIRQHIETIKQVQQASH